MILGPFHPAPKPSVTQVRLLLPLHGCFPVSTNVQHLCMPILLIPHEQRVRLLHGISGDHHYPLLRSVLPLSTVHCPLSTVHCPLLGSLLLLVAIYRNNLKVAPR